MKHSDVYASVSHTDTADCSANSTAAAAAPFTAECVCGPMLAIACTRAVDVRQAKTTTDSS